MTRPDPDTAREQIVEVLGDSVYQALGLKESLECERRALEADDTEALNEAVAAKSDCIARLGELERRRQTLCEASGFPLGPEQMAELADWCDEDGRILGCWSHLMQIATDCNALNQTNGAIIAVRSQMLGQSIAVLRGVDPNPDTYAREGRSGAATNQRSLAEA